MPRYFFQFISEGAEPDLEGTEMADLATARHAAVDIAAEQLKGSGEQLWTGKPWRLEVTDGTGAVVIALNVTAEPVPTS